MTGKNSGRVLLSDTGCNITWLLSFYLNALWDKSWRKTKFWLGTICFFNNGQESILGVSWRHVPEQEPAWSTDNRWFRWSHLINPFTSVSCCSQMECSDPCVCQPFLSFNRLFLFPLQCNKLLNRKKLTNLVVSLIYICEAPFHCSKAHGLRIWDCNALLQHRKNARKSEKISRGKRDLKFTRET